MIIILYSIAIEVCRTSEIFTLHCTLRFWENNFLCVRILIQPLFPLFENKKQELSKYVGFSKKYARYEIQKFQFSKLGTHVKNPLSSKLFF